MNYGSLTIAIALQQANRPAVSWLLAVAVLIALPCNIRRARVTRRIKSFIMWTWNSQFCLSLSSQLLDLLRICCANCTTNARQIEQRSRSFNVHDHTSQCVCSDFACPVCYFIFGNSSSCHLYSLMEFQFCWPSAKSKSSSAITGSRETLLQLPNWAKNDRLFRRLSRKVRSPSRASKKQHCYL